MTVLEICNLALSWLGAEPIADLDEENVRAGLCDANYPALRDAVLEERDWAFASTWYRPAKSATAPGNPRFTKTFPRPANTLAIRDVTDGDGEPYEWLLEGAAALTSDAVGIEASTPVKTPAAAGDVTVRVAVTGTPTSEDSITILVVEQSGVRYAVTVNGELEAYADEPDEGQTSTLELANGLILTFSYGDMVDDAYAFSTAEYVRMRCTGQVTDPALFSAGFCQVLAHRLAHALAVPLTENRTLAAQEWQLYEEALRSAGNAESMQGRAFKGPTISRLAKARMS